MDSPEKPNFTANYTNSEIFGRFFDRSPVMHEIWLDLHERVDSGEPLSQVQQVVVREWLIYARARVERLDLDAETSTLADEDAVERETLRQEISRMEQFVSP